METNIKNNNLNWWKIGSIIAIAVLLFLSGLYIGRQHEKIITNTITEYVPLPPIHDTIPPIIIKEKQPIDTANLIKQVVKDGIYQELFPEKIVYLTDTTQFSKSDSTAIMIDWATKKEYSATLFDSDTLGTCKINTFVQYNKLGNIDYTFTPVYKQETNYIQTKRKLIPFVGVGITTFPSATIETGLFINQSYGFSINGNYNYNPNKISEIHKFDIGLKIYKLF